MLDNFNNDDLKVSVKQTELQLTFTIFKASTKNSSFILL